MKTFIYLCLLCVVVAVLGTIQAHAYEDKILEHMEESRDGAGINVIEYISQDKQEIKNINIEFKFTDSQLEEDVIKYLDIVKPYYYYNTSNHGKALTIEELKEQGGVCKHYALWYIDLAKADGYYAYKERTDWRDGTAHAKAKITSIEGNKKIECYVDQLKYWCNELYG